MSTSDVAGLIEAQDMNGLLRVVDGWCAARRWDDLVDLADRCEEAVERGKQMWPIAAHIDYRLALEGPPDLAAEALGSQLGRFMLGPLTEVAASTHTWAELASHIDAPHHAAFVAQERVIRGEDLTGDDAAAPDVLELPLCLQPWEPTYALASYRADHLEVMEPWEPKKNLKEIDPPPADALKDEEIEQALLDLVQPWTQESNGAARVAVVEGAAEAAVAALTLARPRATELTPPEAVQRMAWAAASGGAHGRRRGAALGRSLAWHLATVVTDATWPPEADRLGEELATLRWLLWDEGAPEEGWVLRIAVEDPEAGWAAAIAATDIRIEDEEL